ncbi:MAG: hypothetical protein AAB558_02855 [Patescibacteria group bacterium]
MKKQKRIILLVSAALVFFVLLFIVIFFILRGTVSTQVSTETNEDLTTIDPTIPDPTTADLNTSWVYVTDELRVYVSPKANGANCSIEWFARKPEALTLYTINTTGERRTLADNINSAECIIAEDIADLGYIGITINGEDVGGLEAPDGDDPGGSLMHALSLPDNPTTLYPTPGQWNYSMTASDANLNCVTGSGGISADGSVDFVTTNYGMTASLSTGSSAIFFIRAAYANPHYVSPQYSTVTGSVEYTLDVLDQEYMKGTLHMQGDVCSGDFPIEMTLETPSGPPIYVPHQGNWNIQYAPLLCGNTPILAGTLTTVPSGVVFLTVTGGGPAPMTLSFSGAPSGLILNQSLGTNLYSGYPNMLLGVANDVMTGQPFQLMGNWNVTALSDSLMMGTLMVFGTNGCTGATSVLYENF